MVDSAQGVTSLDGSPVSFDVITPTISAEITHSIAIVDQTVYFTGTAGTDGTALTYAWDLGDGSSASGLLASHVYTETGSYTVTLTASDTCGFSVERTAVLEVEPDTYLIFLPLVLR